MSHRLDNDWFPHPLPDNVVVGDGSWLYSAYAFLHYASQAAVGVEIGRDSGVYHGTFFDLGPRGQVRIGDFCTIVGATISTNGRVDVGDYALIAHEVIMADEAGALPPDVAGGRESRPIVIGRNVWIAARVVLLGGARIGDDAVVGAGAVVDGEVPAGAIVAGNPARVVGSVYSRDAAG